MRSVSAVTLATALFFAPAAKMNLDTGSLDPSDTWAVCEKIMLIATAAMHDRAR